MIGFFRHTLTTNKKGEPACDNRFSRYLCLSLDVSLTGYSSAEPVSVSIRYHKVTNLLNFIINPSENYYRIKYCINFVNKF